MSDEFDLNIDKDTIVFMITELKCNIDERNELNKMDEQRIEELNILLAAGDMNKRLHDYDEHSIFDTIKAYKKNGTLRRGEYGYDTDTVRTTRTCDTSGTARLDITSIFKNRNKD